MVHPPNSARVAFTVAQLKKEDEPLIWQPPVFTYDVDRLELEDDWRLPGSRFPGIFKIKLLNNIIPIRIELFSFHKAVVKEQSVVF